MSELEFKLEKKTHFFAISGYKVYLKGELIGDFSMNGEWGKSFPLVLADCHYYYNSAHVFCEKNGKTSVWPEKRKGALSLLQFEYYPPFYVLRIQLGNVYSTEGKRLTRYYPAARFFSRESRLVVYEENFDLLYFSLLSLGMAQQAY